MAPSSTHPSNILGKVAPSSTHPSKVAPTFFFFVSSSLDDSWEATPTDEGVMSEGVRGEDVGGGRMVMGRAFMPRSGPTRQFMDGTHTENVEWNGDMDDGMSFNEWLLVAMVSVTDVLVAMVACISVSDFPGWSVAKVTSSLLHPSCDSSCDVILAKLSLLLVAMCSG